MNTINIHEILTGISDFRKLVSSDGLTVDPNRIFVDKTLFIKDFICNSAEVLLITRPRRWGKTLALSMLQHFLSKEVEGLPTKDLFNNLKITKFLEVDSKCQKYFGTHPVILVSFKDLEGETFDEIKGSIEEIISDLYKEHDYLLIALQNKDPKFKYSDISLNNYKNKFIKIIEKEGNLAELKRSIKLLSELLNKYHGKKVFILIDEYDNAINGVINKPKLVEKLTQFFSGLFGSCLKGNKNLEKGLVTGVLRVAKANIFSGLNNLEEYTVLDPEFSEYYGFTIEEVNLLLERVNIQNNQEIKNWYNGYTMGNSILYNPWSIMRCISRNGDLEPYWVDSGNPGIVKDLLINNTTYIYKQKIRDLIKDQQAKLDYDLEKHVSYEDLSSQPEILWSLLVHTGYLTLVKSNTKRNIKLPNQEIRLVLQKYINNWFISNPILSDAANSLLIGDFAKFEEALKKVFSDPAYSARIFSGGGYSTNIPSTEKIKEFVYQFLIMTELRCVNLSGNSEYEVFAELENVSVGKTRPDLLVLNHKQKLCVVGEIKVAFKNEDLKVLARDVALAQIDKNQYGKRYQAQGYQILKLGLAFKGNNFELAY